MQNLQFTYSISWLFYIRVTFLKDILKDILKFFNSFQGFKIIVDNMN